MTETKHLTIMFTDVKGFTDKTAIKKREDFEKFLDLHEKLIIPIFKEFNGKIVKTIGDAFMVVFTSPTNAVLCGIKIQEVMKKHNENPNEEEKIEVRVAINSGEVHIRPNDVFGEAVNIASRLEGIAEANDVYFTESVYLAMNKSEIPSAEVGYRRLKGIPDEIKVYKVIREGESQRKIKKGEKYTEPGKGFFGKFKSFWHRRKKWIIGILIFLFLIGIITNPLNIIKKEANVDKFITNAENVINSGNYEEAKKMVARLEKIPEDQLPPKLALEGAKLYVFLRQPKDAYHMIGIAKTNSLTKADSEMVKNYINEFLNKASPEQKTALETLIKS